MDSQSQSHTHTHVHVCIDKLVERGEERTKKASKVSPGLDSGLETGNLAHYALNHDSQTKTCTSFFHSLLFSFSAV